MWRLNRVRLVVVTASEVVAALTLPSLRCQLLHSIFFLSDRNQKERREKKDIMTGTVSLFWVCTALAMSSSLVSSASVHLSSSTNLQPGASSDRALRSVTMTVFTDVDSTACAHPIADETYATTDCISGVRYQCERNLLCLVTEIFERSSSCDAKNPTQRAAMVCEQCIGTKGSYSRVSGCGSGSVWMEVGCADASCSHGCRRWPLNVGHCRAQPDATSGNTFHLQRVEKCDAVHQRTYASARDCSGAVVNYNAIAAGLCLQNTKWVCGGSQPRTE